MKDLVSIIIPVYNVEGYLSDCIESVCVQSYKNIEIILVDDGSTDSSGKICDKYKSKDTRIKVIHKENGGLSSARNVGIDVAGGQCISFVDSDDFVAEDFIQSMLENLHTNQVSISACGYCHYFDSGEKKTINFENIKHLYHGNNAQKYLNIIGYYNVSACNKLFEKSLFQNIRFPEGKKSEDWSIMYKLIENAGGLYYDSDIKYYYRQRQGSITKAANINYDCIVAAKDVYEYYIVKDWVDIVPIAVQSLAFAYIGVYNAHLRKTHNRHEMEKLRKNVLKLRKNISYEELSKMRKIQLFLFMNMIHSYNVIFRIYKSSHENPSARKRANDGRMKTIKAHSKQATQADEKNRWES